MARRRSAWPATSNFEYRRHALNLTALIDAADRDTEEFGRYRLTFVLAQDKLLSAGETFPPLQWNSIRYAHKPDLHLVPDDKRGVYAFSISRPTASTPEHGYVLYIGLAGRDPRSANRSPRSLRERYSDYLKEGYVNSRPTIRRMIAYWSEVLQFSFAAVDDDISYDELHRLERHLNDTFVPPFSQADYSTETRQRRAAFP